MAHHKVCKQGSYDIPLKGKVNIQTLFLASFHSRVNNS